MAEQGPALSATQPEIIVLKIWWMDYNHRVRVAGTVTAFSEGPGNA